MICSYCAKEIHVSADFCPYCGQEMSTGRNAYYVIHHSGAVSEAKALNKANTKRRRHFFNEGNIITSETVRNIILSGCEIMKPFAETFPEDSYYSFILNKLYEIVNRLSAKQQLPLTDDEYKIVTYLHDFLVFAVDTLITDDSDTFYKEIIDWSKVISNLELVLQSPETFTEQVTCNPIQENSSKNEEVVEDEDAKLKAEIEQLEQNMQNSVPAFKIHSFDSSIDYSKELVELIGLDSVKNKLNEYITSYQYQLKRKELHPDLNIKTSFNCVFKGRPGTGKTTVAKLVSGILKSKGLLKKGHCIEIPASELISPYIGVSGQITKLAVLKSMGGILFIDEAYTLMNNSGTNYDAGANVIDTLTPLLENYRGEFFVILAGYNKDMDMLLANSNVGFSSRFQQFVDFEDYTPDEMMTIFKKMAFKEYYKLDKDTLNCLNSIFKSLYNRKDIIDKYANARTVRTLFDIVKSHAMNRISKTNSKDLDMIIDADCTLSTEEQENLGLI